MSVIIGKILTGVSALGILFTLYGRWPIIWVILCIVFFLLGLILIFFKLKTELAIVKDQFDTELEKLKTSGEKITVEFENCEFRSSSYTNEIVDDRVSRFGVVNLDHGKVISKELITQSLLIYSHNNGAGTEIFKEGFEFSADGLKLYVLKNAITLYVDRFDRKKYFFELKD